jgi:WD40 repeat protein
METRDRLLLGGRHGAAIVKGKGTLSSLIRYLTGDLKPKMPPDGAVDLERISLIRRWIDEGAKIDGMIAAVASTVSAPAPAPAIDSPHSPTLPAPVTSLAYSPDGSLLAVGGYRTVRLLDSSTGALKQTFRGASGQVQALAWSSDGKLLAAAGGVPAVSGEVLIFDYAAAKPIMSLSGHLDVVYTVCWKPQSRELASGSLDKTIRIWNTGDGSCTHMIRDHADAVFSVAYSPDGKLLASGSADRSVKLFETGAWKRVAALTAHQDAVTHVAFNQNGTLLATAGADRQMRVWKVDIGRMENPIRSLGEDDTINSCAFSPDGSLLVYGASDHKVKVFNGDGANQKREMKEPEDWVYAVAVGADNRTVAAGTQDGRVFFWDVTAGKLLRCLTMQPDGPKPYMPAEVKH